jgi:hypothetical protein
MRFSDEVDGPSPATIEQKKADEQQKQMMAQGQGQPGQPGQPPNQQPTGQSQQQQQGGFSSGNNASSYDSSSSSDSGSGYGANFRDFAAMSGGGVSEGLDLLKRSEAPTGESEVEKDTAVLNLLKDIIASGGGYQLDERGRVAKVPKPPKVKTPKIKTPRQPKAIGFGKKPVGTRVYGAKNIRNTNSASFGQKPEKIRGGTANLNNTTQRYNNAPKQPKLAKPPKAPVFYSAAAGLEPELAKALADGMKAFGISE